MRIREPNLRTGALLEAAYLCAIIALCILCMLLGGCGGVQVSGAVDAQSDAGTARIVGDADEVCGALKPRRFPLGLVVCYDAEGKARVCVTTDAGDLACYERGL